jgi:T5SS/PEP-CTERM-associated repeat protein
MMRVAYFSPSAPLLKIICCLLALVYACLSLSAATFTVTTTNDSGAGSLRAAMTSANGTGGGTNLIQFNILPTNSVQTITPVTQLPAITRPVIIDGYTQPGAGTNSNALANGFNGTLLIEISGAILGNNGDGLSISGSGGSTIRGLVIDRGWSLGIRITGSSNNVVEGCFLGIDPGGNNSQPNTIGVGLSFDTRNISSFNRIGGTNAGSRNVIGNSTGVLIQDGTNNVVQGNYIGTDATGTNGLPCTQGIQIGSGNNLIGGTDVGARNVITASIAGTGIVCGTGIGNRIQGNFIGTEATGGKALGLGTGIRVDSTSSATQIGGLTAIPGTPPGNVITAPNPNGGGGVGIQIGNGNSGNIIQGNVIGTDASGLNPLGNGTDGVSILGAFNVVGGTNVMTRNVISANGRFGVRVGTDNAQVHDNLIQNNFIGTDVTGTNLLGNSSFGVYALVCFSNAIQSNVIAGNHSRGVGVDSGVTSLAVLGNSIFGNSSLGIDLGINGRTDNDAGDIDPGPNLLQNFPVISGVSIGGGNVTLSGTLNSGTNAAFRLEFFSNPSCDDSGNGEGQAFLGFTNVTTDASGSANFALTLANPSGGAVFTATATDTNGNTSEFSACASVSGPCTIVCPANIVVSTAPNQCGAVVNFSATTSGDCGAVISSPASGSFFPKGITMVTCTSASGTNCSFTVTVNDTIPPTITCPANIVTNVPLVETGAVVNYSAPLVFDNCGVVSTNSSPPSGSIFPVGVTVVTCTATDTSGNTNSCSFTVTVTHSNAQPVAVCRNLTTNAVASCDANIAPAAMDNGSFDPDGTIVSRVLSPAGPYPKGTNLVTLTVVDNQGASNSCTANIIVVDATPPTISCPANIVTNAPQGQSSVVVNFPNPAVVDNCGLVSTNFLPPSGSLFSFGVTPVTCTVTDTSGNTNTCSFSVTVNPTFGNSFWTNPVGGNYNVAGNWLNNLVPGALDNANFTNNATYRVTWTNNATAANAFFNASGGLVTQSFAGGTWFITNTCIIGQIAGSTAAVAQTSGRVVVTNAVGTGVFEVRRGTNRLHAGTLDIDRLVVTNAAGKFELYAGTLITRGATISNNSSFTVGAGGGGLLFPAIWDVRSGTNVVQFGLSVEGDVVGSKLLVTNGAKLFSSGGFIGFGSTARSNVAVVAGPGSAWNTGNDFDFGGGGSFNQVVISNAGAIFDSDAIIGNGGSSNTMSVIGAGSVWSNAASLSIYGTFNQLVISDGGKVSSGSSIIDSGDAVASHNTVSINGTGSIWEAGQLYLGSSASFNQLTVSNGGVLLASEFDVGFDSTSTNNRVLVDGGTLRVTNGVLNAPLDIRRGTNQLNSGLIEANVLILTNTLGTFEFNSGTLNVRTSTVANGQRFFVGNGIDAALLNLVGTGVHSFTNAVTLRSNATLAGNGIVSNVIIMQSGARLVVGSAQGGIGKLFLSLPPSLNGTVIMEISKNGTVLTNDQIQLAGSVTYGGSLIVSNLGPTALASGDRFQLFSATAYKNIFLSLNLPPLPSGLTWANKLAVDGSIEVIGIPRFEAVVHSGTNLVISGGAGPTNASYTVLTSTNVALALTGWTRLVTNQFDNFGDFIFTNGIDPAVPRRFYRLQVP